MDKLDRSLYKTLVFACIKIIDELANKAIRPFFKRTYTNLKKEFTSL